MTTESTKPAHILAEGEPMNDLLEALDGLAARSNATGADWIPIHLFYEELNRIHAEACRRLGEPPEPVRAKGLPEPDFVPDEEDLEDALAFWMVVHAKARNDKRGSYLEDEEFWAEIDEEIAEYEQAFDDYKRISPDNFQAALQSRIAPCRQALGTRDCFSAEQARLAFDPMIAGCLSALVESQQLTTAQFREAFEPRVAGYREVLSGVRRPNRAMLLAQAVASFAANLTEISESDNFPGIGLMASAAWSVAAYELALAADEEFPAGRFWRVFDSEIRQYADLLAEHQASRG